MSGAIEKLVQSRQKTVDMLTARIAEYEKQKDGFAVGSAARTAIGNAIALDKQRLARVQSELDGFKAAVSSVDPRQASLPVEKKGR